jgi:hypothetical protein
MGEQAAVDAGQGSLAGGSTDTQASATTIGT